MAACTVQENDFLEPIAFSVAATDTRTDVASLSDNTPGTRANSTFIVGNAFHLSDGIGVFGYYTAQAAFGDGTAHLPNFMYDQLVTKQDEDTWTYAPLKYWPNGQDDKVTFYGYYPYGGTGITLVTDNDTPGLPRFDFAVQPYSHNEVDFMVSDVNADGMHITAERTTTVTSRVQLLFHHALSKVIVKVVDEENNPLPFTATLTGLYAEGTCQSTTTSPVNWSNLHNTSVTFSTQIEDSESERVFLLLPQALRGGGTDPCMQFSYSYKGTPNTTEVIHLNTIDEATVWNPSKTYTYVYHVSNSGGSISVNVNPWYQAGMVFNND